MKKLFIVALAAVALLCSCSSTDKCKCTIDTKTITLRDQIVLRPEDKTCSSMDIDDVELLGGFISIELSNIASVKCVNYNY